MVWELRCGSLMAPQSTAGPGFGHTQHVMCVSRAPRLSNLPQPHLDVKVWERGRTDVYSASATPYGRGGESVA